MEDLVIEKLWIRLSGLFKSMRYREKEKKAEDYMYGNRNYRKRCAWYENGRSD